MTNDGLSIATLDGEENQIVCTRSSAIPTQTSRNLAFADELPSVPSNISEFNNDVGYITASASAITSLETSVASLASSVAAIDVTKIYDNAQNKTKYVNGNCEVFNWEMIYTPWVFSDGVSREVSVTYEQSSPYTGKNWMVTTSDMLTLPHEDCFYATKEEAETTLAFSYLAGQEQVEVSASRTRYLGWKKEGDLALKSYVDSQIGQVLTEEF